MVADDPQALVIDNKDELPAIISSRARDFVELSDRFGMLRICQIERRTDSVGRPVLETGAAVAAGLGSSSGTKAIAKTDPDAGNSTLPPGGSRRTFRSASTGSPGFVMSTMAKAFLSVRRRNT